MAERHDIYKCVACGDILEVLHAGPGNLSCCGQSMQKLDENTEDTGGHEKHVPVTEKKKDGIIVRVGSIAHPMEDAHYIQWIEVISDGRSQRVFLKPGDEPKAEFGIPFESVNIVREHCNIHGLWKA